MPTQGFRLVISAAGIVGFDDDGEICSGFLALTRMRNLYKIEVGAQFPHVIAFRRALRHYALINWSLTWGERVTETCANRECCWRIHAAVAMDRSTVFWSLHNRISYGLQTYLLEVFTRVT